MKKTALPLLILVLLVPGCGLRKKSHKEQGKPNGDTMTQVDIPVAAADQVKSYFDEDLKEFALADEESFAALNSPETINEYAWVEEDAKKANDFKNVYFDFDRHGIKKTQEQNVAYDVETVKKIVNEQLVAGNAHPTIKVIVEGHACHSAGSALYNLALSEKRAKIVSDRLVASGVPREFVKIVGRGQEVPAVINGKVVSGNREEQWLNRRAELRVLA